MQKHLKKIITQTNQYWLELKSRNFLIVKLCGARDWNEGLKSRVVRGKGKWKVESGTWHRCKKVF